MKKNILLNKIVSFMLAASLAFSVCMATPVSAHEHSEDCYCPGVIDELVSVETVDTTCAKCGGNGTIMCPTCEGKGVITTTTTQAHTHSTSCWQWKLIDSYYIPEFYGSGSGMRSSTWNTQSGDVITISATAEYIGTSSSTVYFGIDVGLSNSNTWTSCYIASSGYSPYEKYTGCQSGGSYTVSYPSGSSLMPHTFDGVSLNGHNQKSYQGQYSSISNFDNCGLNKNAPGPATYTRAFTIAANSNGVVLNRFRVQLDSPKLKATGKICQYRQVLSCGLSSGNNTVTTTVSCPTCNGARYSNCSVCSGTGHALMCPDCNGVGYASRYCSTCSGDGIIQHYYDTYDPCATEYLKTGKIITDNDGHTRISEKYIRVKPQYTYNTEDFQLEAAYNPELFSDDTKGSNVYWDCIHIEANADTYKNYAERYLDGKWTTSTLVGVAFCNADGSRTISLPKALKNGYITNYSGYTDYSDEEELMARNGKNAMRLYIYNDPDGKYSDSVYEKEAYYDEIDFEVTLRGQQYLSTYYPYLKVYLSSYSNLEVELEVDYPGNTREYYNTPCEACNSLGYIPQYDSPCATCKTAGSLDYEIAEIRTYTCSTCHNGKYGETYKDSLCKDVSPVRLCSPAEDKVSLESIDEKCFGHNRFSMIGSHQTYDDYMDDYTEAAGTLLVTSKASGRTGIRNLIENYSAYESIAALASEYGLEENYTVNYTVYSGICRYCHESCIVLHVLPDDKQTGIWRSSLESNECTYTPPVFNIYGKTTLKEEGSWSGEAVSFKNETVKVGDQITVRFVNNNASSIYTFLQMRMEGDTEYKGIIDLYKDKAIGHLTYGCDGAANGEDVLDAIKNNEYISLDGKGSAWFSFIVTDKAKPADMEFVLTADAEYSDYVNMTLEVEPNTGIGGTLISLAPEVKVLKESNIGVAYDNDGNVTDMHAAVASGNYNDDVYGSSCTDVLHGTEYTGMGLRPHAELDCNDTIRKFVTLSCTTNGTDVTVVTSLHGNTNDNDIAAIDGKNVTVNIYDSDGYLRAVKKVKLYAKYYNKSLPSNKYQIYLNDVLFDTVTIAQDKAQSISRELMNRIAKAAEDRIPSTIYTESETITYSNRGIYTTGNFGIANIGEYLVDTDSEYGLDNATYVKLSDTAELYDVRFYQYIEEIHSERPQHTVTVKIGDSVVYEQYSVYEGNSVVLPTEEEITPLIPEGYIFTGIWEGSPNYITEDRIIKACLNVAGGYQKAGSGMYECMVIGSVGCSYLVTIPKTIVLDGASGHGTFKVTVKADLGGLNYIGVVARPANGTTYILTEAGGKRDASFTVTQPKQYFIGSQTAYEKFRIYNGDLVSTEDLVIRLEPTENTEDVDEIVSVESEINAEITAGTWKGIMVFDIYEDVKGILD